MQRQEAGRVAEIAATAAAEAAAEAQVAALAAASEEEEKNEDAGQFAWPEYDSDEGPSQDDGAQSTVDTEVAAYAREPPLLGDNGPLMSEDPLHWWRVRRIQYPILSRVARRYLAIPASSAAVERMFSYTGMRLSRRNARLDIETLLDYMLERALQKFIDKWSRKYLPIARDMGLIQ